MEYLKKKFTGAGDGPSRIDVNDLRDGVPKVGEYEGEEQLVDGLFQKLKQLPGNPFASSLKATGSPVVVEELVRYAVSNGGTVINKLITKISDYKEKGDFDYTITRELKIAKLLMDLLLPPIVTLFFYNRYRKGSFSKRTTLGKQLKFLTDLVGAETFLLSNKTEGGLLSFCLVGLLYQYRYFNQREKMYYGKMNYHLERVIFMLRKPPPAPNAALLQPIGSTLGGFRLMIDGKEKVVSFNEMTNMLNSFERETEYQFGISPEVATLNQMEQVENADLDAYQARLMLGNNNLGYIVRVKLDENIYYVVPYHVVKPDIAKDAIIFRSSKNSMAKSYGEFLDLVFTDGGETQLLPNYDLFIIGATKHTEQYAAALGWKSIQLARFPSRSVQMYVKNAGGTFKGHGRIEESDENLPFLKTHWISTMPGHSGAGVLTFATATPRLVGIHVSGHKKEEPNNYLIDLTALLRIVLGKFIRKSDLEISPESSVADYLDTYPGEFDEREFQPKWADKADEYDVAWNSIQENYKQTEKRDPGSEGRAIGLIVRTKSKRGDEIKTLSYKEGISNKITRMTTKVRQGISNELKKGVKIDVDRYLNEFRQKQSDKKLSSVLSQPIYKEMIKDPKMRGTVLSQWDGVPEQFVKNNWEILVKGGLTNLSWNDYKLGIKDDVLVKLMKDWKTKMLETANYDKEADVYTYKISGKTINLFPKFERGSELVEIQETEPTDIIQFFPGINPPSEDIMGETILSDSQADQLKRVVSTANVLGKLAPEHNKKIEVATSSNLNSYKNWREMSREDRKENNNLLSYERRENERTEESKEQEKSEDNSPDSTDKFELWHDIPEKSQEEIIEEIKSSINSYLYVKDKIYNQIDFNLEDFEPEASREEIKKMNKIVGVCGALKKWNNWHQLHGIAIEYQEWPHGGVQLMDEVISVRRQIDERVTMLNRKLEHGKEQREEQFEKNLNSAHFYTDQLLSTIASVAKVKDWKTRKQQLTKIKDSFTDMMNNYGKQEIVGESFLVDWEKVKEALTKAEFMTDVDHITAITEEIGKQLFQISPSSEENMKKGGSSSTNNISVSVGTVGKISKEMVPTDPDPKGTLSKSQKKKLKKEMKSSPNTSVISEKSPASTTTSVKGDQSKINESTIK